MADNITAPAAGSVLATDDIGGVHYPRTKISIGADGAASDVHSGNPLPVTGTVGVTGTVPVSGTFFQATQPVSGTVGVSGSVAVTGTFWQATQPISAASLPLPTGAGTAANQAAILAKLIAAPATEAKQDAAISAINGLVGTEYETVAASQTTQALGATGATGDLLVSLLVIPATTSPGAISIKDGGGTAITVFAGGASSVATLHPFSIPLNIKSGVGAWQVTTGANVSVIAVGNFT